MATPWLSDSSHPRESLRMRCYEPAPDNKLPTPPAPEELLVASRFRVVRVSETCRDGSLRTREIVEHPGSVLIVPLVGDDAICLIRNARIAVGCTLWELPARVAGTMPEVRMYGEGAPGEHGNDTALIALFQKS